jgi:hypothetical protein
MVSVERLKELLEYNPITGEFTRKITVSNAKKGTAAGCKNCEGYKVIRIDGLLYYAHRLAWLYIHGFYPNNVDHIDGNKNNNCISNLRVATTRQNNWNRSTFKSNSSGFKGVSLHKETGKWRARIRSCGKYKSLGLFRSPIEAHTAYSKAAAELHGEFFNAT